MYLTVFSNIKETESDSEESDSDDDEEDDEQKPELEAALIKHNGCVNRIRVFQTKVDLSVNLFFTGRPRIMSLFNLFSLTLSRKLY